MPLFPAPLRPDRAAVIVPLVASDLDELTTACRLVAELPTGTVDLVEWRLDHFLTAQRSGEFAAGRKLIAQELPGIPVLGCYRTPAEEGRPDARPHPPADSPDRPDGYVQLITQMARHGDFALIDIERSHPQATAALAAAQSASVPVVLSEHHFAGPLTPDQAEAALQAMAQSGAQVGKLAVMPHNPTDVTALMHAAASVAEREEFPLIVIAMGPLGTVTRIGAPAFGSCASYCTAGAASAPGQVPAQFARPILDSLSSAD